MLIRSPLRVKIALVSSLSPSDQRPFIGHLLPLTVVPQRRQSVASGSDVHRSAGRPLRQSYRLRPATARVPSRTLQVSPVKFAPLSVNSTRAPSLPLTPSQSPLPVLSPSTSLVTSKLSPAPRVNVPCAGVADVAVASQLSPSVSRYSDASFRISRFRPGYGR